MSPSWVNCEECDQQLPPNEEAFRAHYSLVHQDVRLLISMAHPSNFFVLISPPNPRAEQQEQEEEDEEEEDSTTPPTPDPAPRLITCSLNDIEDCRLLLSLVHLSNFVLLHQPSQS